MRMKRAAAELVEVRRKVEGSMDAGGGPPWEGAGHWGMAYGHSQSNKRNSVFRRGVPVGPPHPLQLDAAGVVAAL